MKQIHLILNKFKTNYNEEYNLIYFIFNLIKKLNGLIEHDNKEDEIICKFIYENYLYVIIIDYYKLLSLRLYRKTLHDIMYEKQENISIDEFNNIFKVI